MVQVWGISTGRGGQPGDGEQDIRSIVAASHHLITRDYLIVKIYL